MFARQGEVIVINRRLMSCVLAVLALVLSLVAGTSSATAATDPVRIMVVGDSITHGRTAASFTWRYRLA